MYKIESFQKLVVWQKAMDLVVSVYKHTSSYPKFELYGLSNQTQRSSVSIPSNIAEGYQRLSRKEYVHFLSIALGSSAELRTQLILASRLGYISQSDTVSVIIQLEEVEKLLKSFVRSLSKSEV